jgi:hypothetical protein
MPTKIASVCSAAITSKGLTADQVLLTIGYLLELKVRRRTAGEDGIPFMVNALRSSGPISVMH